MALHRTTLVIDAAVRGYPVRLTRRGQHRADGGYARRVPARMEGPLPGRHRAPGSRPQRPRLSRWARRRRLASIAVSALALVTAISAWVAASGAVALAAMVR